MLRRLKDLKSNKRSRRLRRGVFFNFEIDEDEVDFDPNLLGAEPKAAGFQGK